MDYRMTRTPRGYEKLTVSSSSVGLASIPAPSGGLLGPNYALVRVQGANIMWRPDGSSTAPTASNGMPQFVDEEFELFGGEIESARFIRKDSSDATIHVAYYRV